MNVSSNSHEDIKLFLCQCFFPDSSSSLDESFSSDGQLHERIKDIKIISSDSNVQSIHNSKTKEVELRKSIKEKLCSGRDVDCSLKSDTNTRPGVF